MAGIVKTFLKIWQMQNIELEQHFEYLSMIFNLEVFWSDIS